MLSTGQEAMQRPVEIEFAGNIGKDGNLKGRIYWLQIRPIIDRKEDVDESVLALGNSDLILRSQTALGHGTNDSVSVVVYVRPEHFSSFRNPEIAQEISRLNKGFMDCGEGYVLIGPGRWGSSDNALGIPVKWADISAARLIVESSLANYRVEPSQGTHFFQNLTSFGVGYFTVNPFAGEDYYDIDYLNSMPAEYESETLRIVRMPSSLVIGINGRKGTGVVAKPGTVK